MQTQLLELAFEMATSAHRGIFSQTPNRIIRGICDTLVQVADHIIQVNLKIINYSYLIFNI